MPSLAPTADSSAALLADYFFIAGIESSRIFDNKPFSNGATSSPHLTSTIEEDAREIPQAIPRTKDKSDPSPAISSKRFSYETRKSMASLSGLEGAGGASNRSSATIRPIKENGHEDADFDSVLKRFVADRENVIAEIQFSSGQVPQPSKPAPKPRARTQKLAQEEGQTGRSPIGSVRKRLSARNPLGRSNTARRTSARQSRRISGYNSVIPAPQRFSYDPHTHPLKRPYEPALLDRYPSVEMNEDLKRRMPFPDYVPMFVFPNDINVVSSDERPRSTWHGFAMTAGDGSKIYGITLIMWLPLNQDAAEELERQCEDWRQRNMTPEERELASSLGERLASERAHLSELLVQLPSTEAGTEAREAKEEEISAVEERITMMTDMLRPVRHGAASKIEGLTDGDSGFWFPRAYGVLGRDVEMTSFWKEWLRAITVPMYNGAILRIPPSSPKVGLWQPLERYVMNLCTEALSPFSSKTQVELAIRELRMYARRPAINEIPGCRNTDLYPLFRSLSTDAIVSLFEFVLMESRIILLSSYTSMLHLTSAAIVQLLYPLRWAGVFIPVLPARLIQALEAPCPYIVGIERRYENVDLPEDDFVLVDLDNGTLEASAPPEALPKQQRRKLLSILQLAAPHYNRYGVPKGPPNYATEAFPFDSFCTESPQIFKSTAPKSTLASLAGLSSTMFGNKALPIFQSPPVFNAFYAVRNTNHGFDRPSTSSTGPSSATTASSATASPSSSHFSSLPSARAESSHSGNNLSHTLREKRSGLLDTGRRNSSLGMDRMPRRPSLPFAGAGHASTTSISTLNPEISGSANYAPSVYAQSTLAASTVMPNVLIHQVHNTESTHWMEGHCMQWNAKSSKTTCSICEDKADEGYFCCSGCGMIAHNRCLGQICIVCPVAFHSDQIIAAFVRCFASLFYTYRKYMTPAPRNSKDGTIFKFNKESFLKSVPHDTAEYLGLLYETQAFNEFIAEREVKKPEDPDVRLFDEIILSKRNRGRPSFFARSHVDFLSDTSDHLWRTAAAPTPSSRGTPQSGGQRVIGRAPAKLDGSLLKEPRVMQGVPRQAAARPRRKQVPSMLNLDISATGEPSDEAQS